MVVVASARTWWSNTPSPKRLLACAAACASPCTWGVPSAFAQAPLEVVAFSGSAAPGLSGRTFGQVRPWTMTPDGRLAFGAVTLAPGSANRDAFYALLPEQNASPQLLLTSAIPAPGQPANVLIAGVGQCALDDRDGGYANITLSGPGVTTANNRMLVRLAHVSEPKGLTRAGVLRTGTPITPSSSLSTSSWNLPFLSDAPGQAALIVTLSGAGVNTTNDTAVLQAYPAGNAEVTPWQVLTREGDPGSILGLPSTPALGPISNLRIGGGLSLMRATAQGISTVGYVRTLTPGPALQSLFFRTGQEIAGFNPTRTVSTLPASRCDMSSSGAWAFAMTDSTNEQAIWAATPTPTGSPTRKVISNNMPAPGLIARTITEVPAANVPPGIRGGPDNTFGVVVFTSGLGGSGPALYTFRAHPTNAEATLRPIAFAGQPIANLPSASLGSISPYEYHVDGERNAAFVGTIMNTTTRALFTAHPTAGLRAVLRNGETILVAGQPRTVSEITMSASIDGPLYAGNLVSADGLYTFHARFTDNTQALFLGKIAGTCNDLDFNNDTITPDSADFDDFLGVFAGGSSACPGCDPIDFNNDGIFPDFEDLEIFLRVLSGGPCTP